MASPLRVLLVVGEQARSEEIAGRLRREKDDVSVTQVTSASAALDAVTAAAEGGTGQPPRPFDCVVSGDDLGDGDGLALLARFRALGVDLPFVLFPADPTAALAAKAFDAGVTDYVPDVEGAGRVLSARIDRYARDSDADGSDPLEESVPDGTDEERDLELYRERERFSDLFSNFPEPTIAYGIEDGRTVFRSANTAFEEVFGHDEAAIVGEPVNDLLVPASSREESEEIDQQVETGEMVDRVVRRLAADGPRIFNLRSIPVSAGGEIEGFAVYADITERIERKRELERQNDRLEEFASIVSHDLRNPLNVAMGHLELVDRQCDSPSIANVSEALDRMETLIHETLQLARQGQMVTETEPIRLASVVDGCWEMVDSEAATLELAGDVRFRGDRSRVRQLFENLFRNAVEHGSTGSRTQSDDAVEHGSTSPDSGTRQDATEYGVTVRVGGDDEVLFVEDDGPGIPEEKRDDVFDAGHTTTEDGTGFGLAIVEEIVDAHDWEICVTGGTDGGARFEITGVDVVDE